MRPAISISSSLGVKSTSRLTKLKRTPRTPASCRSCSSTSLTARLTVATPRALPPDERQASTIARLSAPWQVACTITLRSKPRWSRNANSCAFEASQGVYLRSGANGNWFPGPNTWQCASTAPGGSLKRGLVGLAYQSSQPGVFTNSSAATLVSHPPRCCGGRDSSPAGPPVACRVALPAPPPPSAVRTVPGLLVVHRIGGHGATDFTGHDQQRPAAGALVGRNEQQALRPEVAAFRAAEVAVV